MTLPTTHENLNTATTNSHLAIDGNSSGDNEDRASPASDCGTKRPFDEGATTETDARAKRARKTPVDSPAGTSQVEQSNVEASSHASAAPLSIAPEPSHQVPSGKDVFMDGDDMMIDRAGSSIQPNGTEEDTVENLATGPSAFLDLPFDVLADILILTGYPGDILAVARTCKQLCTQLVSPAAGFVWKKARMAVGLPDPLAYESKVNLPGRSNSLNKVVGVGRFRDRESAYAAFVFDQGVCESCKKSTDRVYTSFALELRLCDNPRCRAVIRDEFVPVYLNWLPTIESSSIFDPHHVSTTWPKTTLTRKSLLSEEAKRYESLSPPDVPKMVLAIAHNNVWMQFCLDLYKWCTKWESNLRYVKQRNEQWSKTFAKSEGWNYSNMLADTSFGQFYHDKYKRRETIKEEELEKMRPTIARELLQAQEKKHWKTVTNLKKTNLNGIWKFYQKLLSQRTEYPYVPSFSVFLQLPAVQLLQLPDMAAAELSVKAAVGGRKNKSFMNNMVKQQINRWVEGVKRELLEKLGGSSEWNKLAPSLRMPHPVLCLDARWRCQICNWVESKYELDGCLDFAGVCRHECREKDGMKRKKGEATQAWSTSNFVKDEQAHAIMTTCLNAEWLRRETAETIEETRQRFLDTIWRCLSCNPPLLVPAGCIIGHSHRHPLPMKVELVHLLDISEFRRLNAPGVVRWLKSPSNLSQEWSNKNNYGCHYCASSKANEEQVMKEQAMSVDIPPHPELHEVPQTTTTSSETEKSENNAEKGQTSAMGNDKEEKKKQFENRFNFNGLRSHLSSKHKIYQVRDEDFFCHRSIKIPENADYPRSRFLCRILSARMYTPDSP